ncbi:MAG: hypothetical protein KC983_11855 [Phycisphaerales bacterium]|nr:hypothetical protein [Phycisphaerales bacterium]
MTDTLEAIGTDLRNAFVAVIDALPDGPPTPTPLSLQLDINRVIASRLLNAIAQRDPYEVLHRLPGPNSLRAIVDAATQFDVSRTDCDAAHHAIDRFAGIIRDQFGTRSALNAAISAQNAGLQQRFEASSRYHVYKGMRQVLGVAADVWLTSMTFVPSHADDEFLDITTIHGALGMRRLRPDANVSFTFGPPHHGPNDPPELDRSPVGLQEFYTNRPATLATHLEDGRLVHRLVEDSIGRHAVVDMLAVSHNARGSLRYATPERRRGGVALFADIPVKTLICDALLHKDAFPGAEPEFIAYNPGARGPANPNDPSRDRDRIDVPERIESLGTAADRFNVACLPNYASMVARVCAKLKHAPDDFRVYRMQMAYPVHGFQFVMAFDAPTRH